MRLFAALAITSMVGIVAPADEGSSYQYVDLGPKGNQALAQDIGAEGNHLKEVPQGEHDFGGTKFKVGEKMVHVRGESKPDLPEKVEGIQVDAKFDKLHILQATEFGEGAGEVEDGTAIGAYVVHYADKTEETIPIVYGEDVRDWWDWKGRNELKRPRSPGGARTTTRLRTAARSGCFPRPGPTPTLTRWSPPSTSSRRILRARRSSSP
jgi:hypothetical protein